MKPDSPLSAFGTIKTLLSWVEDPRCRVKASELVYRLRKGWGPERALTEPSKSDPQRSLFKGVTFNRCRGTWLARYWDGNTVKHLGSFRGKSGELLAAAEYDRAVTDTDAELNFPAS